MAFGEGAIFRLSHVRRQASLVLKGILYARVNKSKPKDAISASSRSPAACSDGSEALEQTRHLKGTKRTRIRLCRCQLYVKMPLSKLPIFPPTAAARIALPPPPVIAHNLQLPQNIFCCVSCSLRLILHLIKLFCEAVSALTRPTPLVKECPSRWKLTFHRESRCSVGNLLRGPTALRPRY